MVRNVSGRRPSAPCPLACAALRPTSQRHFGLVGLGKISVFILGKIFCLHTWKNFLKLGRAARTRRPRRFAPVPTAPPSPRGSDKNAAEPRLGAAGWARRPACVF